MVAHGPLCPFLNGRRHWCRRNEQAWLKVRWSLEHVQHSLRRGWQLSSVSLQGFTFDWPFAQRRNAPVLHRCAGGMGWRARGLQVEDSELAQVAAVSAGNNEEVGQMIAEALSKVGRRGVVTLEEGKSAENSLFVVEGMQVRTPHPPHRPPNLTLPVPGLD